MHATPFGGLTARVDITGRGRIALRVRERQRLSISGRWDGLRERAPNEPPWVWDGFVARGDVTLIAGKPKVGKSTLATALATACDAQRDSFVGRDLAGGPVVYVSEEGAGTLAAKLPASSASRALTREAAWPKPSWPALIAAAVVEAERIGADLPVIDSLAFWAAFGGVPIGAA